MPLQVGLGLPPFLEQENVAFSSRAAFVTRKTPLPVQSCLNANGFSTSESSSSRKHKVPDRVTRETKPYLVSFDNKYYCDFIRLWKSNPKFGGLPATLVPGSPACRERVGSRSGSCEIGPRNPEDTDSDRCHDILGLSPKAARAPDRAPPGSLTS
jgi:hypothetical protein